MLPIKICCLSSDATDGELEGTALRNLSPPAASAPKKFNSPSSRASTVCCCPQWRVRYRSALAIISALCKMANVKNSALGGEATSREVVAADGPGRSMPMCEHRKPERTMGVRGRRPFGSRKRDHECRDFGRHQPRFSRAGLVFRVGES